MTNYENVGTTTGLVNTTALNVRMGPGTMFKTVGTIYKNEYVRVFAKIGTWYVVQTDSDIIGYKKELDSIFYQLDDLNLELSKQKERYSI